MKLICLQENLKNGLNYTQNIIGKNLTLPILNNILLETKLGRLKISSTNLEIGINSWVSGKIEKEGKITVPAKIFNLFINNLPNKKIELETKNNILYLKCENYKAQFNSLPADDFPLIPEIKGKVFCQLAANFFKKSLLQIINMVALSESRPEIAGVLFRFNKDKLQLVTTDSFRLAEKQIYDLKDISEQSIIIPQKTIQELIRLLSEKNEQNIKIILDQNQILFDLEDIQIISRLIDGQYPDFEQIIPKDFKIQVLASRAELINIIKAASIFSSKINNIKLSFYPQKSILETFTQDPNLGENKTQLPVEINSPAAALKDKQQKIEINFNYRYLLDGLAALDESKEKVFLGFNDEISPVIMKALGDESYFYLVMPIKG